jgi:hypothetical protein
MEVDGQPHNDNLTPKKPPHYPLIWMVGGPQNWSGCFDEKEIPCQDSWFIYKACPSIVWSLQMGSSHSQHEHCTHIQI